MKRISPIIIEIIKGGVLVMAGLFILFMLMLIEILVVKLTVKDKKRFINDLYYYFDWLDQKIDDLS